MGEDNSTPLGITLPEDFSELTDKQIDKHLADISKKFAPFNDEGRAISPEDLTVMTALVEQKELLQTEQTTRATAAAEANAAAQDLRSRMTVVEETAEDTQPDEGDAPAGATGDEPAPEVEAGGEGESAPAEEQVDGEAAAEQEGAQAMAASAGGKPKAKTSTVRPRAVAASKVKVEEQGSHLSIVASSDVPGVPTGKNLSRDELAEALHARARNMRDGSTPALVASINNNTPKNDFTKITNDQDIQVAWAKAHNVQEMVASGGWCAPSETIYDFACDFESMPEALDLPSVTSRRGGLRYPDSPMLADVYADVNSGFTWTEADDIAAAEPGGPTKPCFVIPCPDFNDVRLQAQGICVTAGNLTDRAYPELTNRYIDLVMTAHAHRMNALTIAKVVAASTAVTPTLDADLGAAESLFGAVEFLVDRFRDSFFAGADFTLEGALPRWARSVIRRDIARRNGVPFDQVSNADIAAAFSEIGARFQFISNYQPLGAAALVYPTSVHMLLYPAGAHTRLDGGSLDLGVVRDSTLNATNDYTAAWTEEFWNVVSRCASYDVTVPVCASGNTGAQVAVTCPSD